MQGAQRLCCGCRQQHGAYRQSSPLRQDASQEPWPLQLASFLPVSVADYEKLSNLWVRLRQWQLL